MHTKTNCTCIQDKNNSYVYQRQLYLHTKKKATSIRKQNQNADPPTNTSANETHTHLHTNKNNPRLHTKHTTHLHAKHKLTCIRKNNQPTHQTQIHIYTKTTSNCIRKQNQHAYQTNQYTDIRNNNQPAYEKKRQQSQPVCANTINMHKTKKRSHACETNIYLHTKQHNKPACQTQHPLVYENTYTCKKTKKTSICIPHTNSHAHEKKNKIICIRKQIAHVYRTKTIHMYIKDNFTCIQKRKPPVYENKIKMRTRQQIHPQTKHTPTCIPTKTTHVCIRNTQLTCMRNIN